MSFDKKILFDHDSYFSLVYKIVGRLVVDSMIVQKAFCARDTRQME